MQATAADDDLQTRINAQVDAIKASNLLGRSDPLNRLLDYFAKHAASNDVPKEFEIAHEVFGKDSDFDVAQDATIRVYVHRLRKKIEEYYQQHPEGTDRLSIPRGTYRLSLIEASPRQPTPFAPETPAQPLPAPATERPTSSLGSRILKWTLGALLLFAAGGAFGYFEATDRLYPRAVARTGLWAPLVDSSLRTFYVVGDQDAGDGKNHLLSAGSLKALVTLFPTVNALVDKRFGPPPVTTISRMSPYMLAESNLIYVGTVAQMGILHDVLSERSGIALSQDGTALVDIPSGRQFVLAPDNGTGSGEKKTYAYIACFDRQSGNRIVVIAGMNDGALTQLSSIALDPAQIDQLTAKGGSNFEAVYSVSVINGVNVGSRLELVRPLKDVR